MLIDNSQFSPREKEVVELLLQGKSNKQIALALSVSVSTVEFHLKNVYRKLQVKSRTEAILQLGESIGSDEAGKQRQSTGSQTDKQRESIVDGISVRVENDGNTIPKRRISMKQRFYIIGGSLLAIVLVAVIVFAKLNPNKAQTSSPAVETQAMAGTGISYEGTSFTIPSSLGDRALNEYIPQSNPNDLVVYPIHIRSILENYPLRDKMFEPQILIFPAKEFAQINQESEATITTLQNILTAQSFSPTEPLPFLPNYRARQVFHTQEKFLSFKNGSGIRYLTWLSQEAFPAINIEHADVLYFFQGLTSDGKYYVSIIMPVSIDYLTIDNTNNSPMPPSSVPFNWDHPDYSKYPEYLNTMVGLLNHDNNPFNPSLASLDALVQSLLISGQ